jgi:hypothetical protein
MAETDPRAAARFVYVTKRLESKGLKERRRSHDPVLVVRSQGVALYGGGKRVRDWTHPR